MNAKQKKWSKFTILLPVIISLSTACQQKTPTESDSASTTTGRYLYLATGLCYSGNGITTFSATTASNVVMKLDTTTGQREILADYNSAPASSGDTPVAVVDWDTDNLLVLVQNGTSGRIESLPRKGGNRSNFGLNPGPATVLATTPRGMVKTPDNGLLILRTGFIEKVNASGIRVGAPYVNSSINAACGTTNSFFSSLTVSPNDGRIIATHAAASPANRIISLPSTGLATSCVATASPQTTTFPVATAFDKTNNKVFVAFASSTSTVDQNSIAVYDYDSATGNVSNRQVIYDSFLYPATYNYLLFGISAMTYDDTTKTLYVSTAISNAATVVNYAIEKFSYDATKIGTANSTVLTRSGTLPFYNYGIDTKCVSSMVVGN